VLPIIFDKAQTSVFLSQSGMQQPNGAWEEPSQQDPVLPYSHYDENSQLSSSHRSKVEHEAPYLSLPPSAYDRFDLLVGTGQDGILATSQVMVSAGAVTLPWIIAHFAATTQCICSSHWSQ
jgi:hypothetical protein